VRTVARATAERAAIEASAGPTAMTSQSCFSYWFVAKK
jgi:hypothetical protein